MGENIVDSDFNSAYIAAAYDMAPYTIAARADWYQVNDNDDFMYDPNGSRGRAFTLSAGRKINDNFSITGEWQVNSGTQQNLRFFQNNERFTEHLFQLALTATF